MLIVVASSRKVPRAYRDALLAVSALPEEIAVVTAGDPLPAAFDGLLLSGGPDVAPTRYGEAPFSGTLEVHTDRDELDFTLWGRAQGRGDPLPTLAICRGLQLVNVALGGTLWQDLPSQQRQLGPHEYDIGGGFLPDHPAHRVSCPSPKTRLGRLFGPEPMTVNSRHHQAIKDLAPVIAATAFSEDGVIEGVESMDGRYLVAVQWHPENLSPRDERQRALFADFVGAVRDKAHERGRSTPATVEVWFEGPVAVVQLNRPSKRNAFAGNMRELLAETIETLSADTSLHAIVITGSGGSFSAGGDLEVMDALHASRDVQAFRRTLDAGRRVVLAIARCPRPVLAAIDGPAAGAGLSLALACDVRIASQGAFFAASFTSIGLAPDWGATLALPELVGRGRACDLVFSADRIGAAEAKAAGLVEEVCDDGGPALRPALARAFRYAANPAGALAAAKQNLAAERLARLESALDRETERQLELFETTTLGDRLATRLRRKAAEGTRPDPSPC